MSTRRVNLYSGRISNDGLDALAELAAELHREAPMLCRWMSHTDEQARWRRAQARARRPLPWKPILDLSGWSDGEVADALQVISHASDVAFEDLSTSEFVAAVLRLLTASAVHRLRKRRPAKRGSR